MSETEAVQEAPKPELTTAEYLATKVPGAPSASEVALWKSQAPNGVVRLYAPDNKRVFILRGITGLELSAIQRNVPPNATNPELELQIAAVCIAVIWTNTSNTNKLSDAQLRTATAGLPITLFTIVSELSDFVEPSRITEMSGDL